MHKEINIYKKHKYIQINPKKYRLLKSILQKLVVDANIHVDISYADRDHRYNHHQ